ncbi:MAG: DUF6510 family protein [Candidatus Dormibacteria bacterium]
MDDTDLMLDGNAAAGMLAEVFAGDATRSSGACAHCGTVADIGAQQLYQNPNAPGAVLRCHVCEGALMVFVRRGRTLRVGLPGLRWLDVRIEA